MYHSMREPRQGVLRDYNLILSLLLSMILLLGLFTYAIPHEVRQKTSSENSIPTISLNPEWRSSPTNGGSYPTGMVSVGWNPIACKPISYNTTSFMATINIDSIYACNQSHLFHLNDVTFQLNAVLSFNAGGFPYSYWVQDVAELNTESHEICFLDNIWNFSSCSLMLYSSSVSGNGSVDNIQGFFTGQYFYSDLAPQFDPGNNFRLNYPATVKLKVISEISPFGIPEVVFQYNDGFGWITYDNAYFHFANNILYDSSFVVSGLCSTGANLPFNSGVIIGGYGNGASTNLEVANFTLGLTYWNGHNYQAPQFGFNEGANTAEAVQGASVSLSSLDGVPVAHVSTGYMTPQYFYDPLQIGNLLVRMDHGAGKLIVSRNSSINSTVGTIQYSGNCLNLTLLPDKYYLSTEGMTPQANTTVDLFAGREVCLVYQPIYEKGLKGQNVWGINLVPPNTGYSTVSYKTNCSSFALMLDPTIWNYHIVTPLFFSSDSLNGSFFANGSPLVLQYFPVGYLLISVCPNNARIYLDDKLLNSSGDSCNLSLRQGTYKFVANINGYRQFSENVTVDLNSYTIINITVVKNSSLLQNPSFLILLFGTIGGAAIVLTIYLAKRRRN